MMASSTCTVSWNVDDLKSSHVDNKVNNQFLQLFEKTYASDDIGHVKAICGNLSRNDSQFFNSRNTPSQHDPLRQVHD